MIKGKKKTKKAFLEEIRVLIPVPNSGVGMIVMEG